jgi:hypothetical protein
MNREAREQRGVSLGGRGFSPGVEGNKEGLLAPEESFSYFRDWLGRIYRPFE